MYIVSVVGQKGGSGKTTLSLNLAVAAARAGMASVILDLDPQANAANWGDRRKSGSPAVVSAPPSRIKPALEAARTNGAQFVVLDNPGKADAGAIAASSAADLVLIPVGPQIFHLETLPGVASLIAAASPAPPAWVVLNGVHPRATVQAADLKALIEKTYPFPVFPHHMSHLEIYGSSSDGGETPLESDSHSRAAAEVRSIFKFTLKLLEKSK